MLVAKTTIERCDGCNLACVSCNRTNSGGPTQAWRHPRHTAVASVRRSAQDGGVPRRQTLRNTDCRYPVAGLDTCTLASRSCLVSAAHIAKHGTIFFAVGKPCFSVFHTSLHARSVVRNVCIFCKSGPPFATAVPCSSIPTLLYRISLPGTPQDEAEVSLEPWLRSPLLSGGVHASEDILGESAWQSLGRRSWNAAWTAEQQGRLVRTRSFMAWGGRSAGTLSPGAARDECMAAVAEEECLSGIEQLRSLAGSEIGLTARVVRATKIPQGLVLWPDVPCVRVTAMVDGLDVSCQEDLLVIPSSGSTAASDEIVEADGEGSSEASSNGHARPRELVLEMQLPKIQMQAVTDDEDQVGSRPALSLRVEFLVGRVVTSTGMVDLSSELKASLMGSSTKRAVVNLTGGGEVVFVFDLNRQAILSPTAGRLPQTRTDIPDTVPSVRKGLWPEVKDEPLEDGPNAARLERFLDNIASWGLEGGSNDAVSRVDSKSPSVGVATNHKFGGSNEEQRHVGSAEQDGSSFPDLVDWLGRSHPDPTFLRLALEKTNSYTFPLVEAPFLAALLKHGGLVGEAFQAAERLYTWDKGEWVHAANDVGRALSRVYSMGIVGHVCREHVQQSALSSYCS